MIFKTYKNRAFFEALTVTILDLPSHSPNFVAYKHIQLYQLVGRNCVASAVPVCHFRGASVSLPWCQCVPSAVPVCHFRGASVSHRRCQCVTSVVPVCHFRGASVSHRWCQCVTSVVPVCHFRGASVSHRRCQCVTSAVPVCHIHGASAFFYLAINVTWKVAAPSCQICCTDTNLVFLKIIFSFFPLFHVHTSSYIKTAI